MSKWFYPLKEATMLPDELGQFGAVRKNHTHEGIDLYGENKDPVFAAEDGVVVGIEWFTGEKAPTPSPWWNNTQGILVEGESGVIVYGEILISEGIEIGSKIKRGQKIGELETVLLKDKGRPMTMLHLELYEKGTRKTGEWDHGLPKPEGLLDPTSFIEEAFFENYKGDPEKAYYKKED
jgi:murein DD-endopeptidase MepM/ murein hydrolase activator NlpD